MKRLVFFLLLTIFITQPALATGTLTDEQISISAPRAILIEKTTGTVIYEKNADEQATPASVTKVMTILLIVEELQSGRLTLEDMVTVSSNAQSMGGSQVYLEEGETMSVRDMLKAIVVSSANDAAVAMAEHISGTEQAFVDKMNSRAKELGMNNSSFTNCSGLFDDENHYTTARDIAIMSQELIKHDMIKDFTTIWMDTLRDGEFGLSNTNKLVSNYEGCTGLKTGFTQLAGYCLSATAERNGVEYIAVVMGAETSDNRFDSVKTLLNYAFANFELVKLVPDEAIPPVIVSLGETESIQPSISGEQFALLEKGMNTEMSYSIEMSDTVPAPVLEGQILGKISVTQNGKLLRELNLISNEAILRKTPMQIFLDMYDMMYG